MTDETVDAVAESSQDTSLDELREEIEDIDRGVAEFIARRTYVIDTVAKVKAEKDPPTTGESQEERMMECAGRNAAHLGIDLNPMKAIFRLFIEINKAEQRQNR